MTPGAGHCQRFGTGVWVTCTLLQVITERSKQIDAAGTTAVLPMMYEYSRLLLLLVVRSEEEAP